MAGRQRKKNQPWVTNSILNLCHERRALKTERKTKPKTASKYNEVNYVIRNGIKEAGEAQCWTSLVWTRFSSRNRLLLSTTVTVTTLRCHSCCCHHFHDPSSIIMTTIRSPTTIPTPPLKQLFPGPVLWANHQHSFAISHNQTLWVVLGQLKRNQSDFSFLSRMRDFFARSSNKLSYFPLKASAFWSVSNKRIFRHRKLVDVDDCYGCLKHCFAWCWMDKHLPSGKVARWIEACC